ncbi:anaphase-promoting complex subunit Hcn1, partial [Chytridiales sp. JEL 0842]
MSPQPTATSPSRLDYEVLQYMQELQQRLRDVGTQLDIMRPLATKIMDRMGAGDGLIGPPPGLAAKALSNVRLSVVTSNFDLQKSLNATGLRWTGEDSHNEPSAIPKISVSDDKRLPTGLRRGNSSSGSRQDMAARRASHTASVCLAESPNDLFAAEMKQEESGDAVKAVFRRMMNINRGPRPTSWAPALFQKSSEQVQEISKPEVVIEDESAESDNPVAVKCEQPETGELKNDDSESDWSMDMINKSQVLGSRRSSFTGSFRSRVKSSSLSRVVGPPGASSKRLTHLSEVVTATSSKEGGQKLDSDDDRAGEKVVEEDDDDKRIAVQCSYSSMGNSKESLSVTKLSKPMQHLATETPKPLNTSRTGQPPPKQSAVSFDAETPTNSGLPRKTTVQRAVTIARRNTIVGKYHNNASSASLDVEAEKKHLESYKFSDLGFHPASAFSVYWDFFMSLIYIAIIWLVPMLIAFDSNITFATHIRVTVAITVLYAADILVDLHTIRLEAIPKGAQNTFFLRDWRKLYFRSWKPVFNVLQVLPFDLIPFDNSRHMILLRFLRLSKLVEIMTRSPAYAWIRKYLEKSLGIGQAFSSIFNLTFFLGAYLHFQSCIIVLMSKMSEFPNPIVLAGTVFDQYTWSLFQAVGNTFPLTYRPTTVSEQWVTLLFVICGAAMYASIVGLISSFAMGMDAPGK